MSKLKSNRFNIIKSQGNLEKFSKLKLSQSLLKSGLPKNKCELIAKQIQETSCEGTKTSDIYKKTFSYLKKESKLAAIHYSLKKALLNLGPTGFYFEQFVAKYFEAIGFTTQRNLTFPGKFVTHEIDIVAKSKKNFVFVECKFHNKPGLKNDVKVALYVKARWDDLQDGPAGRDLVGFYLASNTSFTKDAIDYAKGTGLQLLGVNAPQDYSFLDTVKKLKLYPITSIAKIKRNIKEELLRRNIVLCREVLSERPLLLKLGLTQDEIDYIFHDIDELLKATI